MRSRLYYQVAPEMGSGTVLEGRESPDQKTSPKHQWDLPELPFGKVQGESPAKGRSPDRHAIWADKRPRTISVSSREKQAQQTL